MWVRQARLKAGDASAEVVAEDAQLGLVFADPRAFADGSVGRRLQAAAPTTRWLGCSTSGEISSDGSDDAGIQLTLLHFDEPEFVLAATDVVDAAHSFEAGVGLAKQLGTPHTVLVFAPGTRINGSALLQGIRSQLPLARVTGGLAGDGANFRQTYTLLDGCVYTQHVVAVGFSGSRLRVGYGSYGGWKPFGPARKVTRVQDNVLFELDGESALDVYKRYLGEHAASLPASGLLFPLSVLDERLQEVGLIRTILAVDEAAGTLVLAGDVPAGGYVKLMHASTDSLVQGAVTAAEAARIEGNSSGLVLLVSCVGRKLVMGGRTDEEVDAVIDTLGAEHVYAGFHSYGEISPGASEVGCQLYNQTMAVSFFRED